MQIATNCLRTVLLAGLILANYETKSQQLLPYNTKLIVTDLEQDSVVYYSKLLLFFRKRTIQHNLGKWHTNSHEAWPCNSYSSWPCINGSVAIRGIQDQQGAVYWLSDDNRYLQAFKDGKQIWSAPIYQMIEFKAKRDTDDKRIWCLRLFKESIIVRFGRSYISLDRNTGTFLTIIQ